MINKKNVKKQDKPKIDHVTGKEQEWDSKTTLPRWKEGFYYLDKGAFPPGEELEPEYSNLLSKYADEKGAMASELIPSEELPSPERMKQAYPDVRHNFENENVIRATLRDKRNRTLMPMDSERAREVAALGNIKRKENREKREDHKLKMEAIHSVIKNKTKEAPKAKDVLNMLMLDALLDEDIETASDIAAKLLPFQEPKLASVENKSTITFDPKQATDDELQKYQAGQMTMEEIAEAINARSKPN